MGDTSGGKEIYLLESNLADGEKSSFYNFFVSILASQAPAVWDNSLLSTENSFGGDEGDCYLKSRTKCYSIHVSFLFNVLSHFCVL